jgi:hypothetical protein
MHAAYLVLAGIVVLLWLPVLRRFYASWRRRRNPVSLAICTLIVSMIWQTGGTVWLLLDRVNTPTFVFAVTAVAFAVSLSFHLAFRWARRKFPDARSN